VYLDEAIIDPLGMIDTSFRLSVKQRTRLVPIHVEMDGKWIATDVDWPREPDWWPGGHGLYSTPDDYLRLQRMLLRGGELDGVRVLSASIVDEAFRNQVGDLFMDELILTASPAQSADFQTGPGRKWGLGLMINTLQEPGMRAPGSGAWAGLANTYFWIDRANGVTGALFTQTLPFVAPDVFALYEEFERTTYAQ